MRPQQRGPGSGIGDSIRGGFSQHRLTEASAHLISEGILRTHSRGGIRSSSIRSSIIVTRWPLWTIVAWERLFVLHCSTRTEVPFSILRLIMRPARNIGRCLFHSVINTYIPSGSSCASPGKRHHCGPAPPWSVCTSTDGRPGPRQRHRSHHRQRHELLIEETRRCRGMKDKPAEQS